MVNNYKIIWPWVASKGYFIVVEGKNVQPYKYGAYDLY